MSGSGPQQPDRSGGVPPLEAPYRPPQDPRLGRFLESAPPPRSRRLGIVALVLGAVAILACVTAFAAAMAVGREVPGLPGALGAGWAVLSPARGWVLLGELAFWAGTFAGGWGLVQGIVAVRQRRGRGPGVAAIVLCAAGPVVFFLLGVLGYLAGSLAAGA